MMPVAGSVALNLAFGFAILSFFVLGYYLRTQSVVYYHVGRRLAISVSILSIIATVILLNELLISNFDVDYVAHYTSLETPFIYKITALWAGQAGSLLFWLFVLSLYNIIVIWQNAKKLQQMMPWVILILVFVQLFFLTMTNFITNPFEPTTANFVVANGNGLNPLLQNITMAIHPPMLYLGYIGFVPYGVGRLYPGYFLALESYWAAGGLMKN
jgi:cytochrome c-type biogenesis protein CcmF